MAIRFHKRGLAERLAENRLGLKALERLSESAPTLLKNSPYSRRRKGGRGPADSLKLSVDFPTPRKGGYGSEPENAIRVGNARAVEEKPSRHVALKQRKRVETSRKQKRHKVLASVIIDQLGDAIEQVALKDSKLNKSGEIGGLHSARRLETHQVCFSRTRRRRTCHPNHTRESRCVMDTIELRCRMETSR